MCKIVAADGTEVMKAVEVTARSKYGVVENVKYSDGYTTVT